MSSSDKDFIFWHWFAGSMDSGLKNIRRKGSKSLRTNNILDGCLDFYAYASEVVMKSKHGHVMTSALYICPPFAHFFGFAGVASAVSCWTTPYFDKFKLL